MIVVSFNGRGRQQILKERIQKHFGIVLILKLKLLAFLVLLDVMLVIKVQVVAVVVVHLLKPNVLLLQRLVRRHCLQFVQVDL